MWFYKTFILCSLENIHRFCNAYGASPLFDIDARFLYWNENFPILFLNGSCLRAFSLVKYSQIEVLSWQKVLRPYSFVTIRTISYKNDTIILTRKAVVLKNGVIIFAMTGT